jgi:hypothetical protein
MSLKDEKSRLFYAKEAVERYWGKRKLRQSIERKEFVSYKVQFAIIIVFCMVRFLNKNVFYKKQIAIFVAENKLQNLWKNYLVFFFNDLRKQAQRLCDIYIRILIGIVD